MKVLLILINIFVNIFQPINSVNAESVAYAQILQAGCYLYKTPTDNTNYSNTFFMLENSYFVQLLSDYNDEFYKAKYIDTIGYVKKSQVQCVQGVPKTPFLNTVSFRVYNNTSRSMYDKPFANSNNPTLKVYLPLYCEDLIYYGKIYGESVIEERTNIWYYCKYTVTNECGYVYSDSCDKMDSIVINTEKLPYISSPQWENVSSSNPSLIAVDSNPFKITTALICIPFVIFAILFMKFALSKRQNKKEIDTFNPFE
ncbi:MAG: hypothetical protein IJ358_02910 [Clostridia bacterium]|nr:hypothetical protein [Clostridia bacterium]